MPVAQFGNGEWGDIEWGEEEAIAVNLIVDQAQNALAGPVNTEFIGWTSPGAEGFKALRIYQMFLRGIRDADRDNAYFLKRFLTGPERLWEDVEASHEQLTTLYNIDTVDDKYLKHLALDVGWTKELSTITDKLDDVSLRRLIANSVALWKRRGAAGAYIEVLNTIIGVDAWTWDWFDTRWVLGEEFIGEELQGNDLFSLSADGRRETNLRIVDPTKEIDRDLVNDIVKVWRPVGERVVVTYVDELDRFTTDRNVWKTFDAAIDGAHTIAGGLLSQTAAADQQSIAFPEPLPQIQNYVFRARIQYRGTPGVSDWFGTVFRHDGTAAGTAAATELRIYPDSNELRVYRGGVQVGGTAALKGKHGFIMNEQVWHTMRVQVEYLETLELTKYVVYLDNVMVLQETSSEPDLLGTAGVAHGDGLTLECDSFEIMPWPGENYYIGLNDQVSRFPSV